MEAPEGLDDEVVGQDSQCQSAMRGCERGNKVKSGILSTVEARVSRDVCPLHGKHLSVMTMFI